MKRIISSIIIAMFLLIVTPSVLGASWSAYVLDNSSIGINAANVTAILNPDGTYVNSTLTDAIGFFKIQIPDATSVKLVSSKSNYLTYASQTLPPITANFVLPFNITLIRDLPGNLTGKVTDHVGNGIENATVEAMQGNLTKGSDVTNSSGDYLIADLRDGTYTIKITADNVTQYITNVIVLPGSATEMDFPLTLDLYAPIISNVASSVTASEATIIWTTDEAANSTVYYGTNTSTVLTLSSSTLTTSHSIILSSLLSDTLYYYNISSCDTVGNCNTSTQFNFTTLSLEDISEGDREGMGGGRRRATTTPTDTIPEIICGNDICEEGENCGNCLEDCPCTSGEKCIDDVCRPIVTPPVTTPAIPLGIWLFTLVPVIGIVLILIYRRRKKKFTFNRILIHALS